MKTRMKERMAKRRDRFIVGYIGRKNMAFGKPGSGYENGVEPLTMNQAEALLAAMPCADCAIFELVPLKVNR